MLPDRILKEGTVIISGKKIEEITSRNIDIPGAIVMDARGNYVAPGCIDLHIHGGGGITLPKVLRKLLWPLHKRMPGMG